jgi:hypothetical protein
VKIAEKSLKIGQFLQHFMNLITGNQNFNVLHDLKNVKIAEKSLKIGQFLQHFMNLITACREPKLICLFRFLGYSKPVFLYNKIMCKAKEPIHISDVQQ